MSENVYGLDDVHFRGVLLTMAHNAHHTTPDEMFNKLLELTLDAGSRANLVVKINIKPKK